MLAQDLIMWKLNLFWFLGLLIFGSFALVIVIALYVMLKMYAFRLRQKRSYAEYHRRTRRADGRMYPPVMGGICDACRQVRVTIYFLPSGERLCKACYEPFWRAREGFIEPPAPTPLHWRDFLPWSRRPAVPTPEESPTDDPTPTP